MGDAHSEVRGRGTAQENRRTRVGLLPELGGERVATKRGRRITKGTCAAILVRGTGNASEPYEVPIRV